MLRADWTGHNSRGTFRRTVEPCLVLPPVSASVIILKSIKYFPRWRSPDQAAALRILSNTSDMSNINEKDAKPAVEHIDADLQDTQHVAAHATYHEDHEDTIWQSLRRNPWAFFWCLYACWTIVLVAFETQAAGAVVGIPQFRKDFGFEFPKGSGKYVLHAGWQSAFSGAPSAS